MAVGGLAVQGGCSAIGALSDGAAMLLATRVLEGFGFLAVTVAAPALIAQATPQITRDRAFALWATFMPGGITGVLLAAPLLSEPAGVGSGCSTPSCYSATPFSWICAFHPLPRQLLPAEAFRRTSAGASRPAVHGFSQGPTSIGWWRARWTQLGRPRRLPPCVPSSQHRASRQIFRRWKAPAAAMLVHRGIPPGPWGCRGGKEKPGQTT
jgi:MFS family permease